MKLLDDTVSLIQVEDLFLAVSVSDTLMIGQSSEVTTSDRNDNAIGVFKYADADLPAYYLSQRLIPIEDRSLLQESQFCIGLKTKKETDYFVLLCKQFEQVDLSEQAHNIQELPSFMCNEKMLVQGMLEYQNQVYLVTSPDKMIDYINGHLKQEVNDV